MSLLKGKKKKKDLESRDSRDQSPRFHCSTVMPEVLTF